MLGYGHDLGGEPDCLIRLAIARQGAGTAGTEHARVPSWRRSSGQVAEDLIPQEPRLAPQSQPPVTRRSLNVEVVGGQDGAPPRIVVIDSVGERTSFAEKAIDAGPVAYERVPMRGLLERENPDLGAQAAGARRQGRAREIQGPKTITKIGLEQCRVRECPAHDLSAMRPVRRIQHHTMPMPRPLDVSGILVQPAEQGCVRCADPPEGTPDAAGGTGRKTRNQLMLGCRDRDELGDPRNLSAV